MDARSWIHMIYSTHHKGVPLAERTFVQPFEPDTVNTDEGIVMRVRPGPG